MKTKQTIGSLTFDVLNHIFMVLLCVAMLYPIMNVVSLSLSSPSAIQRGIISFFPVGINFQGYKVILRDSMLPIAYVNTIMYAGLSTILMLFATSIAAYPLSINNFIFKKPVTIFFTITMFFGGGMVPYYLLIKNLHMIDSYAVMIIPGCLSAFNIIIFRTFFQGIHPELRESAVIDGANDIMVLFKVILPLSKPLLATFSIFSIVGVWNSWFNALLYLHDERKYPLMMVLKRILDSNNDELMSGKAAIMAATRGSVNPMNIQMAAVVIVMIPILCIYPFFQRYFVKGMLVGAIKG